MKKSYTSRLLHKSSEKMTNVDVGPGAIVCSEAAITGDVTIGDTLQCNNDIDGDRIIEFKGDCL